MPFFVKMYFLLLKQIDIRRFHIYNFIYIGFCIFMGAEKYAIYYNNCEELDTKISIGEYKSKKWRNVRCRYYYNVIWRFVLKICVIVLPVGLYWICGVL